MLKVVWLILSTYNADTGERLFYREEQMSGFSVSGNPIEDCRLDGVRRAKQLSARFRNKYPNATTNVGCEWRSAAPSSPA